MTVRMCSLVCFLGVIAGARAANAQTAPKESAPPTAATPGPAPSAPAASEASGGTETDQLGRSKWWPSPPPSRPESPKRKDTDELGRSKWWPSPPAAVPESPQGGTAQPAAASPDRLSPLQRGTLFLPHMGISIPLGSNSGDYGVGHSLGALLGLHLTPGLSFNAEVNVDFMNPGSSATETQMDVTASPLFHFRKRDSYVVLGFKLGYFNLTRAIIDEYENSDSYSSTGFVWGFTFGGFVPVGPIALGGLASLTFRHLSNNCDKDSGDTLCHDQARNGINPSTKTLSISAAALF